MIMYLYVLVFLILRSVVKCAVSCIKSECSNPTGRLHQRAVQSTFWDEVVKVQVHMWKHMNASASASASVCTLPQLNNICLGPDFLRPLVNFIDTLGIVVVKEK